MSAIRKSISELQITGTAKNDAELWQQFKAGDADAFAKIIHQYYHDIFNYGLRFSGDRELLKDSLQDVFLVLWKNRQTIGNTSNPKFYLMKTLRRHLQRLLAKKRILPFSKDISFENIIDADEARQEQMIKDEQLAAYIKIIQQRMLGLSPRQQEIIYLRFYAGADMEDIAAVMNIRRQSVYNLLHDALTKLKKSAGDKIQNPPISSLLLFCF